MTAVSVETGFCWYGIWNWTDLCVSQCHKTTQRSLSNENY